MPVKLSTTDGIDISAASHIVGLYLDPRNRTTGYSNCIIDVDNFVSTQQLIDKDYASVATVTELDSRNVHKEGEEAITGRKEFQGGIIANTTPVTFNTNLDISGNLTVSGETVDLTTATTVSAPNPPLNAPKSTVATLQVFEDKFRVVNALPVNPDPNVFYFVVG